MAGLKQDVKNSLSKPALSVSEETVTWPLDREHGRLVRGLTDFIMDQNFLGSLLHVESRIKKCFLASRMLVTILFLKVLNLLSQSWELLFL